MALLLLFDFADASYPAPAGCQVLIQP